MVTERAIERHLASILSASKAVPFTLPPALEAVEAGRQRVAAALRETRELAGNAWNVGTSVEEVVAATTIDAALAGEDVPDMLDLVEQAATRERQLGARVRVLTEAASRLLIDEWRTLEDDADVLLTAHLRPTLVGLVEEIREARARCGGRQERPGRPRHAW